LSVSAKLADYEQTREVLARLNLRELRRLARQNSVTLEIRDWMDRVKPARTKEEVIDVLVDSEFKESDLVMLLGLSRLSKEELLNYMTSRHLRALAKDHSILLEKSTIFGKKKATKKQEIIDVLRILSPSLVRRFSKKVALIQTRVERKVTVKRKSRKRRISRIEREIRSMSLFDAKEHGRFVKVYTTKHAMRVILTLHKMGRPGTLHEIRDKVRQMKVWLDSDQLRYILRRLEDLRIVRREYEPVGKRRIAKFQATEDGKKIIAASMKFLQELEK